MNIYALLHRQEHSARLDSLKGEVMKRIIIAIGCLFFLASGAVAGDQEKPLLALLDSLKGGSNGGLSYEKYLTLLSHAHQEFGNYISNVKDFPPPNAFTEHVKSALACLEGARENWKQKIYWRKEEIVYEKDDWWTSAERSRENQRKYEKMMQEDWKKAADQLALAHRELEQMDGDRAAREKALTEPPVEKKSVTKKKSKARKAADAE